MLDLISVPVIDLIESDQAEELRERHNDWEFVLTEAHHRMKNTLALLAALLRRDLTPAASADLRKAIDRLRVGSSPSVSSIVFLKWEEARARHRWATISGICAEP